MGGSGSTYRPPGSGGADCGDIAFTTAINSPENLSGVQVRDILSLAKNSQMEVLFKRTNGVVVGKLFSSALLKIINCLGKGFEYSAIVVSIDDGVCRVDVSCSKTPPA